MIDSLNVAYWRRIMAGGGRGSYDPWDPNEWGMGSLYRAETEKLRGFLDAIRGDPSPTS